MISMSELYYQLEEVDKELWYNPENPHLTETNVRAITRLNELRDDVLALVSDRSQKLEPNDEDLLLSIVRKFSRLSQRAGILVQDKNIHIVPVSIYLDDAFTEETVKETEAAVANFALKVRLRSTPCRAGRMGIMVQRAVFPLKKGHDFGVR